ncbi:MAG: thioredoxin reductase [Chloroflexi bacterium]|nr:thioredoxin reductase [Chloroflexota bacterium]|tara:strand:- start:926 stop:1879 length:954 start_codon:yes stop_codon:yes gene_type:complete
MNDNSKSDVLIAGLGAAAYSAALYSKRYQIKTTLVGEEFGGETAIGGLIENYPGQPDIDGFDLMMKFKQQVDKLQTETINSNLKSVKKNINGKFNCILDDGTKYEVISVILAMGRERRKLDLENEEEWTGMGVSYCSTCDAPLYKNKEAVAVVGGGNAAVEGAILLSKYAKKVYLIYRGKSFFRPEPILLNILNKTENIVILLETEISSLLGDINGLNGIQINKSFDGDHEIFLDGIFVEIGADPRLEIPNQLQLQINKETGEVQVDKHQNTSQPGIYAAGDLTDGTDLKQTITAASQGAIAALSAYQNVLSHKSRA